MLSRRKSRFDMPPDPAALVRSLRVLRDAMTEAARHLTIGNPAYIAAQDITKAIDEMAFLLTADREYFGGVGGGATEAYQRRWLTGRRGSAGRNRGPRR